MKSNLIGKLVIVRGKDSGVFVGTLLDSEGTDCQLANSLRIWEWKGAFTLNEISKNGIKKEGSKTSISIGYIEINDVIERIPCEESAYQTLINALHTIK